MRPNSFTLNHPLRFEPFLRPMVWGGRRLGAALNKPLPTPEPYGESWEVSDHGSHRSVVAAGPFAGRTLHQLMYADRAALLGRGAEGYTAFPWLIKFLDCHDWLSVQVHPDDKAAKRLCPGERGKTEAWFILEAQPGSRIYAGLLPGTDERRLRDRLAAGLIAECLHSFEPQPGDFVFLPAGTVHAVGGGVLMAELQQTSDATFRLFDWNRKDAAGKTRDLHIEQALASIDWSRGPVQPKQVSAFSAYGPQESALAARETLVQCPYFRVDYVQSGELSRIGGTGRVQAMIVLQGSGALEAPYGWQSMNAGQVWLLPASMQSAACRPDPSMSALLVSLPG